MCRLTRVAGALPESSTQAPPRPTFNTRTVRDKLRSVLDKVASKLTGQRANARKWGVRAMEGRDVSTLPGPKAVRRYFDVVETKAPFPAKKLNVVKAAHARFPLPGAEPGLRTVEGLGD